MRRTYTLLSPILGFREEIGCVVRIPAGAVLDCAVTGDGSGIGVAIWDGDRILVFNEDIVKKGIRVEGAGAIG